MNKHITHLRSKQATVLILTDCISYVFAVLAGLGIAETIKYLMFPDIPAITQEIIIKDLPVAFGFPLIFLIFINYTANHYTKHKPFWDDISSIIKNILVTAVIVVLYFYLTKGHFSRMWFFSAWICIIIAMPIGRLLAKRLMIRMGIWFIPTIVIGKGKNAIETADAVQSDKLLGYKVIGIATLHTRSEIINSSYTRFTIDDDPIRFLDNLNFPYVIVALEPEEHSTNDSIIEKLVSQYRDLSVVPPVRGLPLIGSELSHIFKHDIFLLRIKNNLARQNSRLIKRVFDLLLSIVSIIFLSPIFIYFCYRIRQDGGSILFSQVRIGTSGHKFICYKFRTMVPNASETLHDILAEDPNALDEWNKYHKIKNDPRITPIGRLLRRSSLDELPQLWNVIKGDMSIVGPRPIVEEEIPRYGNKINYYYESWPGMTGLWQVSGRNDMDYEQRVNLDEWYARNWSLWHDIVIIFKTIPVLIGKDGAY